MSDFTHIPPLAKRPAGDGPFLQELRLQSAGRTIASARWQCGHPQQGVAQVVDLTVLEKHRRSGHGTRLLQELIRQAAEYHRLNGATLRRLWMAIHQKAQMPARAFLTQNSFHHTATVTELLRDEDLLIYVRSFD